MIDQSWLNPAIAQDQLALLAVVLLACLIILPLVFGALLYLILSLIARISDARRASRSEQEPADDSPVAV